MPSASSLFLSCFFCRKLLLEIFSKMDENIRGFFIGQMKTGAKRATPGDPHRPGAAPFRGPPWPACGTRPCTVGHLSIASDAYKIIPDKKTLTPGGFSQIRYRAPPPSPTSFGGQIGCSGTLPRRGLAPGAIFTATAASGMSCE